MKNMSKEEVANFIGNLIFPVEPIAYAGYGSDYQNEFLKTMDSDNPATCLEIEANYITAFIENNNPHEVLDILKDFLTNRPTEYLNNLASRKKEDWDDYVNLVISEIENRIQD